jgi:hypothetical protein
MTHPTNLTAEDPEECVTLLNGLRVPERRYESIQDRVLAAVPHLVPKVLYKAQNLYGVSDWSCLLKIDQSIAGQVVKDLVLRRLVPLEIVECAHEYPVRYRIT